MRIFMIFAALSLFLFGGCSKSGAPLCTDETVKKLVLDISTGELKNQLLNMAIVTQLATTPMVQGNPTYEDWNKLKDAAGAEKIREVVSLVDRQIAEAKMNLTNVRISEKRDDIKKCDCGGDLAFSSGKTIPITYAVQYTEDGKIYVEVFGLK